MATERVALWSNLLQWQDMPAAVRESAVRSIYNLLGCTIGGSQHEAVAKAGKALEPFMGRATCCILGSQGSKQMDAQHAALLNGIASHVHDYDDTHLETIIHPTGSVASALIAYCEYCGGVSGQAFLAALTAGIETECKIGLAVYPDHYDLGYHITSTVGSIGAAVATSKVMGLDKEKTKQAIGLAAVQIIGLREMFGSDTKSFHVGRAAQAGLLAALLAERGYVSSRQALEAKCGWGNVVMGTGKPKLDEHMSQLGRVWEIEKNTFKPFPCGIVKHPIIDAAIQLRAQIAARGKAPEEAVVSAKFSTRVHPLVMELTSKSEPRSSLEAKFSYTHGVAAGLIFGKAGPEQYTDEVVRDPYVARVRDCVEGQEDRSLQPNEAILNATFQSEALAPILVHVKGAIGSLSKPLNNQQLTEKFRGQVTPVYGDASAAKNTSDAVWDIANVHDVRNLARRL